MLSAVLTVCEPVSRFAPPLSFRVKSLMSTPVTASSKTTVMVETAVLRGSGATAVTVAVGRVESVDQASVALAAKALPARSMMLEPAAVRVRR